MFKSRDDLFLLAEKVKIEYKLNHPKLLDRILNSMKYYDLPPMGVGPEGKPFINMDNYLDLSSVDEVRQELENNMYLATDNLLYMTPFGLIPENINNERCLDSFLLNPDMHDIITDAYSYASNISNYHAIKRYYANKFNLTSSWKRVLPLRKLVPFYNKGVPSDWNSSIQHFPKLKKLVDSLPFKHIGFGLIFRSNEDSRLLIHRDSYARNNNLQHLSISLSKINRKVFVYDSLSHTKIYLDPTARSYTFNETDLHGADPQFDHLVLRLDGQFEDWLCKKLGYEPGVVFDWAYDKPQEFIKQHGKINMYDSTDI